MNAEMWARPSRGLIRYWPDRAGCFYSKFVETPAFKALWTWSPGLMLGRERVEILGFQRFNLMNWEKMPFQLPKDFRFYSEGRP